MNVGRSLRVALEQRDKSCTWLAGHMEITAQQVSQLRKREEANSSTIKKLSEVFDLKVSDFIALGETEHEV